ncbi:low affinity iron permease family protein [bacterium]|nr:low affinity iron permease family protein [bacterium]
MSASEVFRKFSQKVSKAAGSFWTFLLALVVILTWILTGPLFNFSDTWQLVINTGTTIVTFLMVFIIQNTQNRDSKAIQIKLDELIRTQKYARNDLIDAENMSDADLEKLEKQFIKVYLTTLKVRAKRRKAKKS